METLEGVALDGGLLMVRNINLDAVGIGPDGLRLGSEVWLEDGGITLNEDTWERRLREVGVVDAGDRIAGGGGVAEQRLAGDVEVEVQVVRRDAGLDRHHPVRDVWVRQIGVLVAPASLVDAALRWWKSQVRGGILILIGVADREVSWVDDVTVLLEGGLCTGGSGGDDDLSAVHHGRIAVVQAVDKWEGDAGSLWQCQRIFSNMSVSILTR